LASRKILNSNVQLWVSYSVGLFGYILGIIASILFDLPTGAITVWSMLLAVILITPLINKRVCRK
jgi:zinc/manganese transport system permease protein